MSNPSQTPVLAQQLALALALAYARGKAKLARAKLQAERQAWERDFHENPETQA